MDYPEIDLVYTWVDGNDSNWLNLKKKYLKEEKKNKRISPNSFHTDRFQNLNELKYSLRSVEKYAPFIRKIFIVTNGQIPSWLNVENPKITVINHLDIFPEPSEKYLPTFNSIAIELNLHRIPNLSEYFIYFNDDIFLGNKVGPENFMDKFGKTKVFLRRKYLEKENMNQIGYDHRKSMWLTHKYLNKFVKKEKRRLTLKHVGYMMRKSILLEIEELLIETDYFDKSCTRFRENQNINLIPLFYPYYSLSKEYSIIDHQNIIMKYSNDYDYDKILKIKPHIYCLNSLPNKTFELINFWKKYYPTKSNFEK